MTSASRTLRNVVVTSLAATTSIAGDVDATWKGLLAGESGIGALTGGFVEEFDLPVRIGGTLKVSPDEGLSRVEIRRMSYVERLALTLARTVWKNAGSPEVENERLGVVIGTGLGGGGNPHRRRRQAARRRIPQGVAVRRADGHAERPVGHGRPRARRRAGVITPVSACSSGSEAIAHAYRMIALGDADIIVTGGVEGQLDAVATASFAMMRALSTRNDDPQGCVPPVRHGPRRLRVR